MKDQTELLFLDPHNPCEMRNLEKIKSDPQITIVDQIQSQVAELIKLQNPSLKFSPQKLNTEVERFFKKTEAETYGVWVYYPWRKALVHLLQEKDFIAVRTVRNKYKITQEEQDLLATKKIGIIGLSVGQSVAISLAMERSFGELRIADFDTLELGNMNRLRNSVTNLGVPKTTLVKREIAEIDPFLKVTVFEEGITDQNLDKFFTKGGNLDLLIEECDSIEVKLKARIKAKELRIPVMMDTSDRGMMDIERFDLEENRPIFHGFLKEFGNEIEILKNLGELTPSLIMAILDYKNISDRGKYSLSELGKTITNWPQLGTSVIMGGAMCAHFARNILCGYNIKSGREYVDLDKFFRKADES
ncbi:ThiF family adenylyltransferase [Belliella buryatensis]|uniref:ThiF family adenylyltransferase n=1 Tax=Belliella buryatensis TaxID=1500549 RepID=UPI001FE9A2E2|nr:ThiF family adenylyltransferase [Belliella buryatensis]